MNHTQDTKLILTLEKLIEERDKSKTKEDALSAACYFVKQIKAELGLVLMKKLDLTPREWGYLRLTVENEKRRVERQIEHLKRLPKFSQKAMGRLLYKRFWWQSVITETRNKNLTTKEVLRYIYKACDHAKHHYANKPKYIIKKAVRRANRRAGLYQMILTKLYYALTH